jgi:hypothetical protein
MTDDHDGDVYLRAIEVLEERGWHQGGYESADGRVCIVGALNIASGLPSDRARGHMLVLKVHRGGSDWNDEAERTLEDIKLALKRAAHGEVAA